MPLITDLNHLPDLVRGLGSSFNFLQVYILYV